MTWIVPGGMWPVARREGDLTVDEIMAVLDEFDDYWDSSAKPVLTDGCEVLLK